MPRFLFAALCCLGASARAEVGIGLYGGWQAAARSDASVEGGAALPDRNLSGFWDAPSSAAPSQRGVRATWWPGRFGGRLGFGVDVNRADGGAPGEPGPGRIEPADRLDVLTLNGLGRWPEVVGSLTPYVGGGVGVALPRAGGEGAGAWDDQTAGPAATLMAGASVPVGESWSVFGEYRGTYAVNRAELDGGGTLEAEVLTKAINLGVSFSF